MKKLFISCYTYWVQCPWQKGFHKLSSASSPLYLPYFWNNFYRALDSLKMIILIGVLTISIICLILKRQQLQENYRYIKHIYDNVNRIPGPKAIPLFGNCLTLMCNRVGKLERKIYWQINKDVSNKNLLDEAFIC